MSRKKSRVAIGIVFLATVLLFCSCRNASTNILGAGKNEKDRVIDSLVLQNKILEGVVARLALIEAPGKSITTPTSTIRLNSQLEAARIRNLALQTFTGYTSQVPGLHSSKEDSADQIVYLDVESEVMELALNNGLGCSQCSNSNVLGSSFISQPGNNLRKKKDTPKSLDDKETITEVKVPEIKIEGDCTVVNVTVPPVAGNQSSYPQYVLKKAPVQRLPFVLRTGANSTPTYGQTGIALGFTRDTTIAGTRFDLTAGISGLGTNNHVYQFGAGVQHLQKIGDKGLLLGGEVDFETQLNSSWSDFRHIVDVVETNPDGSKEQTTITQPLPMPDYEVLGPRTNANALVGFQTKNGNNAFILGLGGELQSNPDSAISVNPSACAKIVLGISPHSRVWFELNGTLRNKTLIPRVGAVYEQRINWKKILKLK